MRDHNLTFESKPTGTPMTLASAKVSVENTPTELTRYDMTLDEGGLGTHHVSQRPPTAPPDRVNAYDPVDPHCAARVY
jgi:hypothetical protein